MIDPQTSTIVNELQAAEANIAARLQAPTKISIVNNSTILSDAQIAAVLPALQLQISNHFAPSWGRDANLLKVGEIRPSAWQLVFLNDADQANALGYHDLTIAGLPLGKVFVRTAMQAGDSWTITASHELLEMLGDPDINLAAEVDNGGTPSRFLAYEACDPCEGDQYGYTITSPGFAPITVSDFILPSYFMSAGQPPFDFEQHITKPFQILTDGYLAQLDLSNISAGWQQLQRTSGRALFAVAKEDTRRRIQLRNTPKSQWKFSLR
jgi:hypothetical protein